MKTTHALTTLALAGALMLTGCSSNSSSQATSAPSSSATTAAASATPSPTPTQSQEDLSIEQATQVYKDYVAAGDAAGEAGYTAESLAKVVDHLTADGSERLSVVPQLNTMAEQGITTKGETKIGSVDATSYTAGKKTSLGDDTGAKVVLDACIDPTGKTWLQNGQKITTNGLKATCSEVTLVNQGSWLIDSSTQTTEAFH